MFLSIDINKGGKNNKSKNKAAAIVMAVMSPISEFIEKCDRLRTKKPLTKTKDVIHKATPTVEKA